MKFENVPAVSRNGKTILGVYAVTWDKPFKSVDNFIKKHPAFMNAIGGLLTCIAFLGVPVMLFLLYLTIKLAQRSAETIVTAQIVLPVNPEAVASVAPQVAETVSPFIYYIPIVPFMIAVAVTIFFHEALHYIYFRKHGMKVKNYGVGVLNIARIPTPLPVAFVNPDRIYKRDDWKMVEIAAVAPGINLVLGVFFMILHGLFGHQTLFYLWVINLAVGMLNALPVLALDGSYMFRPLLGDKGLKITTLAIIGLILLPMFI